jgi:phage/plasmid-like protein (TIGR03299 family)
MGAIPEEMVSNSNLTPWHRTGLVVDHYLSADEAYRMGGLDYEISKVPILDSDTYAEVPGRYQLKAGFPDWHSKYDATMPRVSVGTKPQIVSDQYEVIENVVLADIADVLDVNIQTAGTMWNKSFAWILADLGESPKFDGDEIQHRYLLIATHHGKGNLVIAGVNYRVVCENTYNLALKSGEMFHTIRHSSQASHRITAAKVALENTYLAFDEQDKLIAQMMDYEMSDGVFRAFVNTVAPEIHNWALDNKSVSAKAFNARNETRGALFSIWDGDTVPEKTAWTAYQTVNEYELHRHGHDKNRQERMAAKLVKGDFPMSAKAEKILVSSMN